MRQFTDRCEQVPGRCGGRWTFMSSRVEPRHIRARYTAGEGMEVLLEDNPDIPPEDLRWAAEDPEAASL